MRRRRWPGTRHQFRDACDRVLHLCATESEVQAWCANTMAASLYLVYETEWPLTTVATEWRVKMAWVNDGYRRAGIATLLYDYAFRMGFYPLRANRIQTPAGAALWRKHICAKLAQNGLFIHRNHPHCDYWWPLDVRVPRSAVRCKTGRAD